MSRPPPASAPTEHHLGKGASVWVAGDGDPLLLLHGWGLHPRTYRRVLELLARRGFRVAAPAMAVVGRRWSVGRAVHRALKAMDFLEWPRAVVVGNSLGGAVAIHLAASQPGRVRLLALVNSVGLPLDRTPLGWALPFRRYVAAANLRALGAFGANAFRPRGALNLVGAALYASTASLEADLQQLRRNRVRTVLVWSERDRLLPISMGREMASRLGAPLRVVPGLDHDWPLRHPELFARELEIAVREVLARRVPGAGPLERLLPKRRAALHAEGAEDLPTG